MIAYVVHILNLVALSIQNIVNFAALIGRFILTVFIYVSSTLVDTKNNIKLFFEVVYEDNISTFTEDLPNFIIQLRDATMEQLLYFGKNTTTICSNIYYSIISILMTVVQTVQNSFVIIIEVLLMFSKSIVFLGDAVWLILTFIPIHLPQLLNVIINYILDVIKSLIIEAYMNLLNFTNFLTEVPLQSFAGLIISILVIRLSIHYQETIISNLHVYYWALVRSVMYFYYVVTNYITNSEVRIITQIANGEDVETRNMNLDMDEDQSSSQADTLCVICQERQKSVLTLPCRHICLCTECCRRLYGYQRTCPMCRTFIYHSVTVYL